jgi:hypothetical protein
VLFGKSKAVGTYCYHYPGKVSGSTNQAERDDPFSLMISCAIHINDIAQQNSGPEKKHKKDRFMQLVTKISHL